MAVDGWIDRRVEGAVRSDLKVPLRTKSLWLAEFSSLDTPRALNWHFGSFGRERGKTEG